MRAVGNGPVAQFGQSDTLLSALFLMNVSKALAEKTRGEVKVGGSNPPRPATNYPHTRKI